MASNFLPFERGTTWASGTFGAPPPKLKGSRYILDDGTELQCVQNTDAAALSGCKLVDWETAQSGEVHEASGAASEILAGVVDPAYSDAQVRPAVNALFYIVKRGITKVIAGATTTPNQGQVSHGTDGTTQNASDISAAAAAVYGVALASGNATTSVRCAVFFR